MMDDGLGNGDVVRGSNLDVLAVAVNKGDVVAESFDHTGVVGKANGRTVGHSISSFEQLDVEALRRLYQSVLTTRLGAFADMAQRLDDRDNRDDGFRLAGCFVAVADDVDAGEGAYTIMDTHHTLNIVGNECQSVLHGMEARLASVSQEVRVSTYPLRRKGTLAGMNGKEGTQTGGQGTLCPYEGM